MRVAAIQMVSGANAERNFQQADQLLQTAKQKGAEVAVLPEMFLQYGQKTVPTMEDQSHFLQSMSQLARDLNLWIVAGTHPLHADSLSSLRGSKGESRPFACSVVFNSDGDIAGHYCKIHLFDADVEDDAAYRESRDYAPGNELGALEVLGQHTGIGVCYDLRFAEYFIALVEQSQCAIIWLPAAFTYTTGQAHWEMLVRARAVESQCFVVAANQGGDHENGRTTWGGSMIVDPWGEVLARAERGSGVVVASLDLAKVDNIRRAMPVSKHRRLFTMFFDGVANKTK